MQNTNTRGEEEVLAPGGFHQPLLLKKLGNTCLLEQEQNDNNVTKYVLSREDLRRFIVNAMIICPTPSGGRYSFSINALLLQHFCMKQQGCSLGAAMSLLIKFTISQLYQYYLSFLYHTDISFIYLYDITAISILFIFALSQHPFPVILQKLQSSHHQSVQ